MSKYKDNNLYISFVDFYYKNKNKKNYLHFILALIPAFITLIAFYIIDPFKKIRICHLGKLGHIGIDSRSADYYFRKWQIEKADFDQFVFLYYNPSNTALVKLWSRQVKSIENRILSKFFSFLKPVLGKTKFVLYDHKKRQWNLYPEYSDPKKYSKSVLTFTPEEEAEGKRVLTEMGLGEDDWFICFQNRDPAYFNTHYQGLDWSQMEKRDCHIENFLSAAQWVTEQGGFAIRIGSVVSSPIEGIANDRIIDYARNFRSEFMDIYLMSKCRMFLGCTSGPIVTAFSFDRYCALSNDVCFDAQTTPRTMPWTPKLIRDLETGKFLKFQEIEDRGLNEGTADLHKNLEKVHKVQFVENTAEDLLGLCQDTFDLMNGIEPDEETKKLQARYRDIFYHTGSEEYPDITPRFIQRYKHLL